MQTILKIMLRTHNLPIVKSKGSLSSSNAIDARPMTLKGPLYTARYNRPVFNTLDNDHSIHSQLSRVKNNVRHVTRWWTCFILLNTPCNILFHFMCRCLELEE